MGGLAAESRHCAGSASLGADSNTRGVVGVQRIAGMAVAEECSGVAHISEGGP